MALFDTITLTFNNQPSDGESINLKSSESLIFNFVNYGLANGDVLIGTTISQTMDALLATFGGTYNTSASFIVSEKLANNQIIISKGNYFDDTLLVNNTGGSISVDFSNSGEGNTSCGNQDNVIGVNNLDIPTFPTDKPYLNILEGDDTAKYRVNSISNRDKLITERKVLIGHSIYFDNGTVSDFPRGSYILEKYPTKGSLVGVVWKRTDCFQSVSPQVFTGNIIPLNRYVINYQTNEAQVFTNYTVGQNITLGAAAKIWIKTTTEPTVVGAVKVLGAEWRSGVDFDLIIEVEQGNGGLRVIYFFIER